MQSTAGPVRFLFVVLCGLLLVARGNCQSKTVHVWAHAIPGAIPNASYKLNTFANDWGVPVMGDVSDPLLDLYFPSNVQNPVAAVIICPGGGYTRLAYEHEGSQVAAWLNRLGLVGVVLKYRLPSDSIMVDRKFGPLQDAQEAVRVIRRHAKEWGIRPDKIGIMGFSAGGHLAATLSTHFADNVYPADTTSARPDFSILIYPVISMDTSISHSGSRANLLGTSPSAADVRFFSNECCVTANTPPAFLIHCVDDHTVPIQNSIAYMLALQKNNVPCELHMYQSGGHGFGLGRGKGTESLWIDACKKWMEVRGIL